MTKKLFMILLLLVACLQLPASTTEVKVGTDGNQCAITFYTPSIVRVVKQPQANAGKAVDAGLVVVLQPEQVAIKKSENASRLTLQSSQLTVIVDKKTGAIQFRHKGTTLLKEKAFAFQLREHGNDAGAYRVDQSFVLGKDEPVYGLGIMQNKKMNIRGTDIMIEQRNTEDFQNIIQSLKGWGLYWNNYSRTQFKDNADGMSFSSEVGDCVDYFFMYGGNPDGVIANIRQLTGGVPMLPLWSYGFFQSRERYKTQEELLEVLRKYRELQIPIDCMVQDWQYWGSNYQWNAMEFLAEEFPRPQAMIDEVHKKNAKLMITIWSNFGPATKAYRKLAPKNLLFNFETWPQSGVPGWPPNFDYPSGVRVYDVYSKEARDIYWEELSRLHKMGIDGWWMDSTDPDFFNAKEADFETKATLGTWRRMRNAFPLYAVSGVHDNQRAASSDKRVFIMTRSGFAGQQRYGSNVWSGDVASTWEELRKQIPAGLNFTLTGNPNFNSDIGGFFAGRYNNNSAFSGPNNPLYRELYVRWMQYGLFCPVFRSHGSEVPREIYLYGKAGEPIYDALVKTIRMRYTLIPYLYSTAWQVTKNNRSYMRPLMMDFASDKRTWNMTDEFMFGESVLAAPIVRAQYTPEKVMNINELSGWLKQQDNESVDGNVDFSQKKTATKYLPNGTRWYDFHTGKAYEGGQDVTMTTTIDYIPMFVRAGSILPVGPEMQYVSEKPWDNLEIRIYPGRDAEFTLYEDEGDNYNYENGAYAETTFRWDDSARTLNIADRKGEYKGMLKKRNFKVVLVSADKTEQVEYDGKGLSVKF